MTDTSEHGFESIIINSLVNENGYVEGSKSDYDRANALDLPKLLQFLRATQPNVYEYFALDQDGPSRRKFLDRLNSELLKRGLVDVLRKGINHTPHHVDLFYGTPTEGNEKARQDYEKNIFSVTRQVRYSENNMQLALDLCIFINGLPAFTFELKNNLTKQTVEDAVRQYKTDRDPRETIFRVGRCLAHFAVDDQQIMMCANLKGKESWFLPFNKGFNDGAGNPPNPCGIATDYLWKQILAKDSLTNIIENFASRTETKNEKTDRKKIEQIFPRYHQLDVVRKLLADAKENGAGRRYLIQHSAGSGKSNSISWLAHQLAGLNRAGRAVFDTVIVVTDRRVLDKQLRENVKRFMQVSSTVGSVTDGSYQLRQFIEQGKKIIITTVQKFPFILKEIGDEHRNKKFAIIIDEAHSSQGGRTASKMNMALAEPKHKYEEEEETLEDQINKLIESKKMLTNASYFAFTATPKNKTLEIFGEKYTEGDSVKHRPFHCYTMKQAIQEGFILDVLRSYTPVNSYYKLVKAIEEDPKFDKNKANKKLRKFVEGGEHPVRKKAEIMIDHFHDRVIGQHKIGGKARAMVVCNSIERTIQYYHAFRSYLKERKSPYEAIVAFSGEHEYLNEKVTEAKLNGFASGEIPERFEREPYRFLIVADKFQTGFDQPLLHTMYVDKHLSGIKAVQTLSRLNRAHPQKTDTFVLDFMNDTDVIQFAFSDYYRTTILSDETDPNKLYDLQSDLEACQIYNQDQIDRLVTLFLSNQIREMLDPILDISVSNYKTELDEDGQVGFKSNAKSFVRTYNFLSTILPTGNTAWEKLAIFLNFLIPKLPAPIEEDLSKGILETIDMDSYRAEVQETRKIDLADENSEIDPILVKQGGLLAEAETELLSNILKSFNDQFGNTIWKNEDRIQNIINNELPKSILEDEAFRNAASQDDLQNTKIEFEHALNRSVQDRSTDEIELYRMYQDNSDFRKSIQDFIFQKIFNSKKGMGGGFQEGTAPILI